MTADENKLKLQVGISQRDKILPVSPTLEGNPQKIGYFQQNVLSKDYFAYELDIDDTNIPFLYRDRTARIFVKADNHMHCTPVQSVGDEWCIQFERQGVYKTPGMGW